MFQRVKPLDARPIDPSRNLAAWSLLAGLALISALAAPFWAGRVYTADDLGAFHLPSRAQYAQQLARGEPFDWTPQIYCGFYMTGEGQTGGYHPLHWLLYRVLPLHAAFAGEILLSYPLMMAGMWLFLRRRLGRADAAMFGGLLFAFCGFNLLHLVHPNAIAIIAHIPWLLWAIDIVLTAARRRQVMSACLLIALLTGSQLLLGYPQYVWFSLLIELGYAVFLFHACRYAPRRGCDALGSCADCIGCNAATWPWLLAAKIVGLLIGGVQILPTAEALTQSARLSVDPEFVYWGSLHPLNLVQLVAPYLFANRVVGDNTHEFGLYLGVVPVTLAVWVLVCRHELTDLKPLAKACLCVALLSLAMSFGAYSPLYRLVAHVPLLNVFRFPCRYLCLFEFAAAVFAAIGFLLLLRQSQLASEAGPCDQEDAVDREDAITWGSFEPLWVLVAVACAVAVAGVKLRYEPYIGSVPAILVGPILYLLAVLLVITAARGRRFALIGLILLAAADQGFYGMSYSVYPRNAKLDEYVASAETPPDAADGRVLATLFRCDEPGLRTGNRMTLSGWRRADGYAGLEPRRRLDYRELAALRVAGVRWVRQGPTTKDIAGLRPFNENWSEVPDPLPRARLVARTQVSDAPARDLLGISPEETALTETPVSILPSEPGKTSVLSDRPGLLQIETECPQPQLLVVSESYHPGWQAEVNGQSQRVHRVNGDFVGCVVEAGKSQVVLEFRPQSLEWGWIASLAGMGMASLCLVGSVFSETSFQTKE